jgi:hypothetical protein
MCRRLCEHSLRNCSEFIGENVKFEIKHNWSGAVLFAAEVGNLKLAVELAVKEGADLEGAYLKDADLEGAYLKGAYLKGAYLEGADLTGADLRGAIGLKDAIVDGEPLKHATPEESIANLDRVREILIDDGERLDMGIWHFDRTWERRSCAEEATCGTTHCLAGWLQVCATDERVRAMDPHLAGIKQAPVAAKMFFRGGEETLEWLRERKYADEAKDYA